jgi:hypothetical protein
MVQRILRTVEVSGQFVTVAVDHDPIARRRWVVLRGRLVDELTGRPPAAPIVATTDTPGLKAHVGSGGVFGVGGVASGVVPDFVPPNPPGAVNIEVNYVVRVAGYLRIDDTRTVALPVIAHTELADTFAPLDLGDVGLHRDTLFIRGRTVRAVGNRTEAVSASVTIRRPGIWTSLQSVANGDPASNPDLGALHPPLIRARPVGATLRRRPLASAGVATKSLLEPVQAGTTELFLSNRIGLLAGHLLQIDEENPDLIEWQEVVVVEGAGTPSQPARVQLALPLAFTHQEGALARRMNLQATGPTKALTREAIAGDTTLFVANLTGLAATEIVEISSGGNPREFHRFDLYSATSGANGFFRWPPLSRIAQLEIEADRGGGQPLLRRRIAPDYSSREQVVDLIF